MTRDNQSNLPSFSSFSSLLDPSGHLSQELVSVLDDVFMRYSDGLLLMDKDHLVSYYKDCYPALSQQSYYNERATYILSKYGQKLESIKQKLRNVLDANKDSKLSKLEIVDSYINKRKKDDEDTKVNDEEKEKESSLKSKHFRISIKEEQITIDATLEYEENSGSDDSFLSKSQFFLLYRKLSIVSPIMCRLELTELGYDQFRSGMIVDRTKNLDKIAFNIQQLRNRYQTHLDERKRIEMAASPKQCAMNIESFIQNNSDPLDSNNNNNNNSATSNLFRKRRPIKFPKLCHVCCCCLVACVRCCE